MSKPSVALVWKLLSSEVKDYVERKDVELKNVWELQVISGFDDSNNRGLIWFHGDKERIEQQLRAVFDETITWQLVPAIFSSYAALSLEKLLDHLGIEIIEEETKEAAGGDGKKSS